METTTIEIAREQKAELDSLKLTDGESYKSVLQRVMSDYSKAPELSENRVRELAREEITDRVRMEALE
jgi:hypothetical protein